MEQSTNHILMVEPAVFYANPQTMDTNAYQTTAPDPTPRDELLARALQEFRGFRDVLVTHGVSVTTVMGHKDCPDMIFPNWVSTHPGGKMIIYPMLNDNRRAEKRPRILDLLRRHYPDVTDWSGHEAHGLALESTASIVADHINRRAYAGLSARTSPALLEIWQQQTGYDLISFETRSHAGIPVYHTDYLMFIGTGIAAICSACITDDATRKTVLNRLRETHEVIDLSMAQLRANCGNALEVVGTGGARMLALSTTALDALTDHQFDTLHRHYNTLIAAEIPTIETHGGGSARCMMMELF